MFFIEIQNKILITIVVVFFRAHVETGKPPVDHVPN